MITTPNKTLKARLRCNSAYIYNNRKLLLDVDWYDKGDVLVLYSVFYERYFSEDEYINTALLITSSPLEHDTVTYEYCVDILNESKFERYAHLYDHGEGMIKVPNPTIQNKGKIEDIIGDRGLKPNIFINIGKNEKGKVTNSVEIRNHMSIFTGIGGFKTYLDCGGFVLGITVNGVLLDEDESKKVVQKVKEGYFLTL